MDFGQNIKTLREMKNLSQQALAEKVAVSRSTISHYELNLKTPRYDSIMRIANVLDVPLQHLIFGDDQEDHHAHGKAMSNKKIPIEISEGKVNLFIDDQALSDQELSKALSFIRADRKARSVGS